MRTAHALTVTALAGSLLAVTAIGSASATSSTDDQPETTYGRMILVLDSSGSMKEPAKGGATKIEAAKKALGTVIDGLPEDADVGMRVFGAKVFGRKQKGACEDTQLAVEPGTGNRDDLRSAVQSYKPYGETPIPIALKRAADDIGTEGRRSIVLVSDGESTCGDPCPVAADLAEKGIDLQIDVVGLSVSGKARKQLECIAEKGNGTYYDADDTDGIEDSLDRAAERATRPFEFTGTPIEGSGSAAEAPEITTGQYVDRVPGGDGVWYRVRRTVPNSTIHVGLTHFSTDYGNSGESMLLELYADPDGTTCSVSAHSFPRGNLGYTSAISWREDVEHECNTSDVLYVRVSPSGRNANEQLGKPMELAVYEEPPLADLSLRDLAPKPEEPTWTTLEPGSPQSDVVPGTSFSNAPVVTDGTYALDINPGESQVLAIPLDWGQNLQAQFDASGVTREHLPSELDLGVQIAGPLRSETSTDEIGTDPEPEDWSNYTDLISGDAIDYRTGEQSRTVGYINRDGTNDQERGSAVPGLRYVLVSLSDDAQPIEYTLTLETNGTAGEGAPEYAKTKGLSAPTADLRVTPDGSASTPDSAEADESNAAKSGTAGSGGDGDDGGDGGTLRLVAGSAAGLGGVLALALAAILLVRRRRNRTHAG